jgi:opacity protein-like surface antigen
MKRVLWILPAVLLMCISARAQETPAWEIGGGYSYLHANMNNNSATGPQFDLSGGHVTASENLNDWFGGRIEFNAFNGSVAGTNVSLQTITYGPVFSYRKFERITPYGHVQFGAVHASEGYLGISQSAFKFAMTGGGGVDFNLNPRFAVRVQGDYLMTRFLDLRQDNLQFAAGLVVKLGHRHPRVY